MRTQAWPPPPPPLLHNLLLHSYPTCCRHALWLTFSSQPGHFITRNAILLQPSYKMSATGSDKLGIMQPGAPGTHRMVLDFSNIILGFDSMHATVERAEKMVRGAHRIARHQA